jgi:two-component system alkaline phosphatase synthesis response regulator PhoP
LRKKKYKILVVDDEPDIIEILQYNLEKEGFEVKSLTDSRETLPAALDFKPDLAILDIMMPYQDGVETCRLLRQEKELSETFILFLTARTEEYSEIAAFETGADDYLIKPIRPRALISRIHSLLTREVKRIQATPLANGNLIIDKMSYTVRIGDRIISLPKKEFELLYFLAENPRKIFNRDALLDKVWGLDAQVLSRTVDVHIRKIREKIGDEFITTIKGVGYKFEPEGNGLNESIS